MNHIYIFAKRFDCYLETQCFDSINQLYIYIYIQEAYCLALSKLKEAMEEPQQKSMAFINNMHSQLRELTMATTSAPNSDQPAAATTSSSDQCTFRRNPTI